MRLRDQRRDPIERELINPRADIGGIIVDAETNELFGVRLGNGGHHDCIIVPTKLEHMKQTRSWTLWSQWQPRLNHFHCHPECLSGKLLNQMNHL